MPKFKYKDSYNEKNYKSEFIISCLQVKKSEHKSIKWAKEMKIMNSLAEKCSDPQFWMHARTEFKIPSVAWFLTDNGRKYLNEKHKRFYSDLKISKTESKEIQNEEKQGEDLVVAGKLKTIKDFLKSKNK
jgi:hypothetical protein